MDYKNLGRTGIKVSPLCLGTMNFGDRTDEATAFSILDQALDAGINFIDTANAYQRGRSEEIIGNYMKERGSRERLVIATKVHHPMNRDDPNAFGTHRRHIIQACEDSLRRLQTDTIDLYQLHRPKSYIPIDETIRALDDLIRTGKVRYIGTSTFPAWRVLESLWVSKEYGLNRVVTEQPPYNLLDRTIERELIPMAQSYGIAIMPWSPTARGFFSGKYRRGQAIPDDTRFKQEGDIAGFFGQWIANHLVEQAFDVLELVESLAREKSVKPIQIAMAWSLSKDGITTPIIGPRTIEQLADYLGVLEISLTEEDHIRIDTVSPPGQAIVPYYAPPISDFEASQFSWI
ncbi:MAG: aldo/keto reductase [Chloroflexota bacterium]